MTLAPAAALGLVTGGAMAWWSYRGRGTSPLVRTAALCRGLGVALLVVLAFDPALSARLLPIRPLVLLDRSISMQATGGRGDEAAVLAASLGDTVAFGELAPGEAGGRSTLGDVLPNALASGRPITIVTDGEVSDAPALPPDLLAAVSLRLLPRPGGDDVALVDVRAPERLAMGDTLAIEIEARRIGTGADSVAVEVRDGETVLLRGAAAFGDGSRALVRLRGALPARLTGARWLEIRRVGAPDAEAGDDVRWWLVRITPTPGVVVLAESPDWDARFLYRALRDVSESPVRGYVQLQPGRWRRMDDLRVASSGEVQAAAQGADLLAVRGDVAGWRQAGKARLLWPLATVPGDWYLTPSAASPLASAFGVADGDSLPPATAVLPLDNEATADWVGATAKLARRGTEIPVVGGRVGPGGRTITIGADGLHRWAFRGGSSEQTWRGVIADAAAWLLATPEPAAAAARPIAPVVQRGRPTRFRWTGSGAPTAMAITLRDETGARSDSLRFAAHGEAALALPVGRYRYQLAGGGEGIVGVEPFADELVPAPVTLSERTATVEPVRARRGAREWWPLFGVAVAAFGAEWLLRRRLGFR